jgi:hypothetical protein
LFFRASGGMADALASGASVLRDVGVQVPLRPPCDESGSVTDLVATGRGVFPRVIGVSSV